MILRPMCTLYIKSAQKDRIASFGVETQPSTHEESGEPIKPVSESYINTAPFEDHQFASHYAFCLSTSYHCHKHSTFVYDQ